MEQWRNDSRREPVITDLEALVPQDHLLRKIEKVMDYEWLYERLDPYYCHDNGRVKRGANEKGQKALTTHIWQEYLDIVERQRKTERGKEIYAMRKETIERVFADAKEEHAMRYTHHRGLAAVTRWVRLKYAAMNLKKLANWSWNNSCFSQFLLIFMPNHRKAPVFAS